MRFISVPMTMSGSPASGRMAASIAAGVDQRLVALNVDDELGGPRRKPPPPRDPCPRQVVGAGHADGRAELSGFFEDPLIVSGNNRAGQVPR